MGQVNLDHPLTKLAQKVEGEANLWEEASATVRTPKFVQEFLAAASPFLDREFRPGELPDPLALLVSALLLEMVEGIGALSGQEEEDTENLAHLATAHTLRSEAFSYLGRLRDSVHDLDVAADLYRRLLGIEPSSQLRDRLASTLLNRGVTFFDLGDPERAVADYNQAIAIRLQLLAEAPQSAIEVTLPGVYLNRGNAHLGLGHSEAAIVDYREAIFRYQRLVDNGRKEVEDDLAGTHMNLGNVYQDLGFPADAIQEYDSALEIRRAAAGTDLVLLNGLAAVYLNRGNAYRRWRRSPEAIADHTRAIEMRRQIVGRDPRWSFQQNLAIAYANRGGSYLQDKRAEMAKADCEESIRIFERIAERAPHPQLEHHFAEALQGLASAEAELGRWEEAARFFEQAAGRVDAMIDTADTERHRLARIREHRLLFTGLVTALSHLAGQGALSRGEGSEQDLQPATWAELAAYWAERARARNLANLLVSADQLPQGVSPAEYALFQDHARQMRSLDHQLRLIESAAEGGPTPRMEELRAKRDRLFKDVEAARRRFGQSDPGWIQGAPPLSVDRIREVAESADAPLLTLLASYWGTAAILVLPDRRIEARLFKELNLDDLKQMFGQFENGQKRGWTITYEEFRKAPHKPELRQAWFQAMERTLQELGERLWRPLRPWLAPRVGTARDSGRPRPLVVLAGEGFSSLPVHAAWWFEGGTRRWACEEYQISYAPSIRALGLCLERSRSQATRPTSLLAIRNPTGHLHGASLPASEYEVDKITPLFTKCLVLGHARDGDRPPATRERLKQELPRWTVALLSTHGIFDVQNPWTRSGIYTADQSSAGEPPQFTLSDFYDTDLSRLSLAVISACESALSDSEDPTGEQTGLPSAMVVAGATTVVGSLWLVDDVATALLSSRFFLELFGPSQKSPVTKGEALWRAQAWLRSLTHEQIRELLGEMPFAIPTSLEHPVYWSAFSCYGSFR